MKGSKDTERTRQCFDLDLWKSIGIIYSLRATLHQVWFDQVKGSKYIAWTIQWFDLDLWTCDLKINRDHLLIEGNPCTKFGINQVKGSKDIEQTRQWAEKSGLTLTFEHVTWKSRGIIFLLRATPAPSLVLIKWRGQKILSGQHFRIPTDWHTDRPIVKQNSPFFKGGIIKVGILNLS